MQLEARAQGPEVFEGFVCSVREGKSRLIRVNFSFKACVRMCVRAWCIGERGEEAKSWVCKWVGVCMDGWMRVRWAELVTGKIT